MYLQEGMPAAKSGKQFYKPGRRPRVPLSCDPCRTRKLRCNRETPCQNCSARNELASCKYQDPKRGAARIVHEDDHGNQMRQRIDHLEDLVKKLIAQNQTVSVNTVFSNSDTPSPRIESAKCAIASEAADIAATAGTTLIDGIHSVYKGTDDWFDVLQEINNIKQIWRETQDDQTDYKEHSAPSNTVDGSSLLFSQVKPIEIMEILSTLPPKSEVDKMLSQFFDSTTFPITVAPILHEPTFMREYAEHWKDPSRTHVIWLGLLFSILGIVMLSYHQFHETPEYEGVSESLAQLYRLRTAQCLLIGDMAKCLPYTLETLRFNATAELNRKDDNSRGLWIMTGVIVRAAINMGYHRDPSQLSSISILKAEYRRRVWFSVIGMDDMASFQAGFPRMTPSIYSDAKEPRNLHDWELCEDTTTLPPSRPLKEHTPVTYLIVKGRLFRALGNITDFNNTPSPSSYSTVLEIDKSLYEAYQGFPPHMKLHSGEEDSGLLKSKSDLSNLQLESMYHQGMCTLHRKFIAKGRGDTQYQVSRDRCISSALALLGYQRLLEPSWYTFSRTRQIFTFAAMILFLELELRRRYPETDKFSNSDALLQALEHSCALWDKAKSSSDETLRRHKILASMLSSFHNVTRTDSYRPYAPTPRLEIPGLNAPWQPYNVNLPQDKDLSEISNEMDIDWATWDAFIESTNFEDGVAY